jgi:hypothetical protein
MDCNIGLTLKRYLDLLPQHKHICKSLPHTRHLNSPTTANIKIRTLTRITRFLSELLMQEAGSSITTLNLYKSTQQYIYSSNIHGQVYCSKVGSLRDVAIMRKLRKALLIGWLFSEHVSFERLRKADSHIACRAHAVPLPCRGAKCLVCVCPL